MQNLSASSKPVELWPIYKAIISCFNHFSVHDKLCDSTFFYRFIFQSDHNKSYEPEEDAERFVIFEANLKRIIEHNEKFAKGEVTFTMGINQFTDKKPGEYPRGGVLPPRQ